MEENRKDLKADGSALSEDELEKNRRSKPAKLRIFERKV